MKIALILSGNIRTWDRCKHTYFNTFSKLNPDVFISTYDRRYEYHPYVQSILKKNSDESILSENDIKDFLQDMEIKSIEIEKSSEIDSMVDEEMKLFNPNMREINSCYKQFRKAKNCIDNIIKYENENNFIYDYIIKVRFDTLFNDVNVLPSNDTTVVINNNGVLPNDWAIASKRDNFINVITFMMEEFYQMRYPNSADSPPHQLFQNAIDHNNLTFEKRGICKKIIRVDE